MKVRGTLITLFILNIVAVSSFAQSKVTNWSNLKQLPPNTNVFVKMQKGKTVSGTSESVGDTELKVDTKSGIETLPKEKIEKIWLGIHKSKRGAKLPSIAVFLGTTIIGGILADRAGAESYPIPLLIGSAGAAALVQRSLTKGFRKGDLIYRSN